MDRAITARHGPALSSRRYQAARRVRGFSSDKLRGGRREPITRHDAVDEPAPQRLLRRKGAPREHEIQSERRAEQLHRANATAESGMDAELHLRQSERPLIALGHDAIVAREGKLETSAERKSVDCRHCRHTELGD